MKENSSSGDLQHQGCLELKRFRSLLKIPYKTPWYANVTNYMGAGKLPAHLVFWERKLIIHRSAWYSWIDRYLFYTGFDLQIHRCIREDEFYDILKDFHNEPYSGNFSDRRNGHKVLHMGYY